jgi:hypothetical protein
MKERNLIREKLRRKEIEIQSLEARLREAKGYVRALRELLGEEDADKSMVAMARDIILEQGHPVHITDLLKGMGRDLTREARVSLTSALAAYVRRGDVFTRAGPNTFGLRELNHTRKMAPSQSEPPADFGSLDEVPPTKPNSDA